MATAITTVTKTASVVKTTKGSEKKWSEILSMNRRHDLQLPLDIEKYNNEFKRTCNMYQRQKNQTERLWAHKHETWYQDDFLFRNHLLKQLKPITRRFKHIDTLSSQYNDEPPQPTGILNEEETEHLAVTNGKQSEPVQPLPALKQPKKRSTSRQFQVNAGQETRPSKGVPSKLFCTKMLSEYEPRLHSHAHGPFLDIAQRFLKRKPESLEKGANSHEKQKQQKEHLKLLMENEQKRARVAALKFTQQLHEEKSKENTFADFDDNDDDDESFYTRPF